VQAADPVAGGSTGGRNRGEDPPQDPIRVAPGTEEGGGGSGFVGSLLTDPEAAATLSTVSSLIAQRNRLANPPTLRTFVVPGRGATILVDIELRSRLEYEDSEQNEEEAGEDEWESARRSLTTKSGSVRSNSFLGGTTANVRRVRGLTIEPEAEAELLEVCEQVLLSHAHRLAALEGEEGIQLVLRMSPDSQLRDSLSSLQLSTQNPFYAASGFGAYVAKTGGANVASDGSVAVVGSPGGKNSVGNTSTAAVP